MMKRPNNGVTELSVSVDVDFAASHMISADESADHAEKRETDREDDEGDYDPNPEPDSRFHPIGNVGTGIGDHIFLFGDLSICHHGGPVVRIHHHGLVELLHDGDFNWGGRCQGRKEEEREGNAYHIHLVGRFEKDWIERDRLPELKQLRAGNFKLPQ